MSTEIERLEQGIYEILCDTDWPEDWAKDGMTPEFFEAKKIVDFILAAKSDQSEELTKAQERIVVLEYALKLAKSWIETEEGQTFEWTIERENKFNATGNIGWNPVFIKMIRATLQALANSDDSGKVLRDKHYGECIEILRISGEHQAIGVIQRAKDKPI